MVVLMLGGVTAVLGVLYALMEHDMKRLLAYHTVENIGIIFIGLGLAMVFRGKASPTPRRSGWSRRCFTCSTTRCSRPAVPRRRRRAYRHRRADMERIGGLIHRMPRPLLFLVGCIAISALPPLNGFVSEWLTFQAILLRPELPQWGLKITVPGRRRVARADRRAGRRLFREGVSASAFSAGRAAPHAAHAHRGRSLSLGAMLGCAALCLLAGIFPGAVIDRAGAGCAAAGGRAHADATRRPWLSIVPVPPAAVPTTAC